MQIVLWGGGNRIEMQRFRHYSLPGVLGVGEQSCRVVALEMSILEYSAAIRAVVCCLYRVEYPHPTCPSWP